MFNIGIVVPCYNEENRLKLTFFSDYLKSNPKNTFLFVNDGSQDQTLSVLENFKSLFPQVMILDLKNNSGKAEAVRQGMLWLAQNQKQIQLLGYWDADLATPLVEINNFEEDFIKQQKIKIIFGSRILKLGNKIVRKPLRHYLGRIFATAVSLMTQVKVYDTQCGAKIMQADVVSILFKEKFISKWFFDVEIMIRFKNHIGDPHVYIFERPLDSWQDEKGSKLKLTDFLKAPLELLKIYIHYR